MPLVYNSFTRDAAKTLDAAMALVSKALLAASSRTIVDRKQSGHWTYWSLAAGEQELDLCPLRAEKVGWVKFEEFREGLRTNEDLPELDARASALDLAKKIARNLSFAYTCPVSSAALEAHVDACKDELGRQLEQVYVHLDAAIGLNECDSLHAELTPAPGVGFSVVDTAHPWQRMARFELDYKTLAVRVSCLESADGSAHHLVPTVATRELPLAGLTLEAVAKQVREILGTDVLRPAPSFGFEHKGQVLNFRSAQARKEAMLGYAVEEHLDALAKGKVLERGKMRLSLQEGGQDAGLFCPDKGPEFERALQEAMGGGTAR